MRSFRLNEAQRSIAINAVDEKRKSQPTAPHWQSIYTLLCVQKDSIFLDDVHRLNIIYALDSVEGSKDVIMALTHVRFTEEQQQLLDNDTTNEPRAKLII